MKVPKSILNGSSMLLMGFPECVSSYFLLMQLDKDFKPLFKLLETQPDLSEKVQSFGDLNHVIRVKNVDVGQMQMLEDELNLSLLDSVKLLSLSANDVITNQTSENGLLSEFSIRGSNLKSALPSSFSSVVDEVFELERGSSAPSFSVQIPTSMLNTSPASHIGSGPMNLHRIKAGTSSPNWEVGTQINNLSKVANVTPDYSSSTYLSSNLMGLTQSGSASLLSSGPGRSTTVKKLSASKSDQDLASLRSPHSADVGLYTKMDEDQLMSGKRSARLPRPTVPQVSASSAKANVAGSLSVSRSNSWVTTPVCKIPIL